MKLSRILLSRLASGNLLATRPLPSRSRCLIRSVTTANKPSSSTATAFQLFQFQSLSRTRLRYNSTVSNPPASATESSTADSTVDSSTSSDREVAAYEITFTCKPCNHRSTHRISKQGYHNGTVLITCPECKNRHVISDHLKIFSDKSITIEDLLQAKGEFLQKGTLGAEGDVEFWDDGTGTHTVSQELVHGGERRY